MNRSDAKKPGVRPSMFRPKAKMPERLGGRYFVIVYRKGGDAFTITLDDADKTSYNLGSDRSEIVRRFRFWGHEDLGCRCVDMAKEYGIAQAIFNGNRVRSLHRQQRALPRPDVFALTPRKSYALPSL